MTAREVPMAAAKAGVTAGSVVTAIPAITAAAIRAEAIAAVMVVATVEAQATAGEAAAIETRPLASVRIIPFPV